MYLLTDSYLHALVENGWMAKTHDVGHQCLEEAVDKLLQHTFQKVTMDYFLIKEKYKKWGWKKTSLLGQFTIVPPDAFRKQNYTQITHPIFQYVICNMWYAMSFNSLFKSYQTIFLAEITSLS